MEVIDETKQELLELGFNVDSIGIIYWTEAIEFIKTHPLVWDMMDIYENISKLHNSTIARVERAMRHAIIPAIENIQKKVWVL